MAAKRIAKTAVDWAAFAERVPANQKELFRAFKGRNDTLMNRVHQFPENLPKIDFSFYRSRLANTSMVDQFEKSYGSVTVAYPADKEKMLAKIENDENQASKETEQYVKELKANIQEANNMIAKIDSLPKPEDMNMEMHSYYFPQVALDPVNKPTLWPHTPNMQPGNLKTLLK
ncbi:hypothetical protein ScPMuIL_004980 [Solemya velum]